MNVSACNAAHLRVLPHDLSKFVFAHKRLRIELGNAGRKRRMMQGDDRLRTRGFGQTHAQPIQPRPVQIPTPVIGLAAIERDYARERALNNELHGTIRAEIRMIEEDAPHRFTVVVVTRKQVHRDCTLCKERAQTLVFFAAAGLNEIAGCDNAIRTLRECFECGKCSAKGAANVGHMSEHVPGALDVEIAYLRDDHVPSV